MRKANIYKVLIASPSDVTDEREAICDAIQKWNSAHSESYDAYLQAVRWELDATPEMGDRPQAIINKQIVHSSDILVAVFWTRLGTPTGEFESGTAEEIDHFRSSGKPALLYFSDAAVPPSNIDTQQHDRLRTFRAQCEKEGVLSTFESRDELCDQLQRHLTKTIVELRRKATAEVESTPSSTAAPVAAHLETALASSPNRTTRAFRTFVQDVKDKLSKTKPNFEESEHVDDAIMNQIKNGLPITTKFIREADVAAGYDSFEALSVLYESFGSLLGLCELPADFSGYFDTTEFDGFKFLVYEMFVGLAATLVKAEKWDYLAKLLSRQLFVDRPAPSKYRSFTRLSRNIRSLDHSRNERLGLNRVSVVADVFKTRFDSRTDTPLDHEEFMAGDYFLFVRTLVADDEPKLSQDLWAPRSCLYLTSPPRFIRKSESAAYLTSMVRGTGLDDPEEFKKRFKEGHTILARFFPGNAWGPYPLEDFDPQRLGSIA